MKNNLVICLLALGALSFGRVAFAGGPAQDLIVNGNFSENPSDYQNGGLGTGANAHYGYGYLGQDGNADTIPGFNASNPAGTGIESDVPGLNGGYGPGLPPANYGAAGDPTYFVFLQNSGTSLTQTIDLNQGELYTLSFESAPRSNAQANDSGEVSITSNLTGATDVMVSANTTLGTDFTTTTVSFYALVGGASTITLANTSTSMPGLSSDETVDFSHVAVLTPEPGTYTLLGLGLGILLLARRGGRALRS